ncbi:hypothetical protein [Pirellula sp. SH-Sr6A]|uniref:hypothetical protein n=1 Tax=Pirellula sp. SH-Sr6A TaxID=1632865 RepID=UPI0011BA7627|nr:hypothetical protein [Pirellula sp. SH-Sr6A]
MIALSAAVTLALVAVAQQSHIKVPKPSVIAIPARPEGKYGFVSSLVQEQYADGFREKIPFEFIELKQWGQFDPFTHEPGGTEYRILLWRDGKAEYEGTTGVEKIGLHRGEVAIEEYGKLALLLELFGFDAENCDVGFEVMVSHPVVAAINVGFDKKDPMTRRNANGYGDYRFWLIQSAIENVANTVIWKPGGRK